MVLKFGRAKTFRVFQELESAMRTGKRKSQCDPNRATNHKETEERNEKRSATLTNNDLRRQQAYRNTDRDDYESQHRKQHLNP